VTTQAVSDTRMNFRNTPIEFKESTSSSFSMQFKIKIIPLMSISRAQFLRNISTMNFSKEDVPT